MTIRFTQDMADVMAYQDYHFRNDPQNRRTLGMIRYLYPLVFIFLGVLLTMGPEMHPAPVWIAVGICTLAWIIFSGRWVRSVTLRRFRKSLSRPGNGVYFGEREMTFDGEGFRVVTDNLDDTVKWPAVVKAVRRGDYIFILLSAISAFVIPLRKLTVEESEKLTLLLDSVEIKQENKN